MSQTAAVPERSVAGSSFVFFGGSTGMGRAAAIELGRRGARVLIVGRGREAGEAAAAKVRAAGALSADVLCADLATVAGVKAAAEGVLAWSPVLHGVMHTAMAAFNCKQLTTDGFEFAFALQYFARAALNRLLADALAASGDGRIVHAAGNVPGFIQPDLDDLQFERRKWGFFKSVLGTHVLGYLHIQEFARRCKDRPLSIAAACVESVKTKAMQDPAMPLVMRLMGRFGTTPELASRNALRLLVQVDAGGVRGVILRKSKVYVPETLALDPVRAARLWDITSEVAARHGLKLPWA